MFKNFITALSLFLLVQTFSGVNARCVTDDECMYPIRNLELSCLLKIYLGPLDKVCCPRMAGDGNNNGCMIPLSTGRFADENVLPLTAILVPLTVHEANLNFAVSYPRPHAVQALEPVNTYPNPSSSRSTTPADLELADRLVLCTTAVNKR
ncbi:hypothetical protein K435DRAFT_810399 [Dendrothele bispora CBS 962.96]|uniref:Extracellular membrane protein CFEM domain-containing protein n=1 Tax=Dendrothele bispora (strain CBS 962.96) TaxID=1314807 RepID=A0A4S8KVK6_DENBC|nr:hypothetical protein K435DRAFT_810399 [Dendrothele bispora CBS 962.96]